MCDVSTNKQTVQRFSIICKLLSKTYDDLSRWLWARLLHIAGNRGLKISLNIVNVRFCVTVQFYDLTVVERWWWDINPTSEKVVRKRLLILWCLFLILKRILFPSHVSKFCLFYLVDLVFFNFIACVKMLMTLVNSVLVRNTHLHFRVANILPLRTWRMTPLSAACKRSRVTLICWGFIKFSGQSGSFIDSKSVDPYIYRRKGS